MKEFYPIRPCMCVCVLLILMGVLRHQVTALLDSGGFALLVKKALVPIGCIDYSLKTNVVFVQWDVHTMHTPKLRWQWFLMSAGGVDQLLVDIIFGTGLPMIFDLLQKTEGHNGNKGVMFGSYKGSGQGRFATAPLDDKGEGRKAVYCKKRGLICTWWWHSQVSLG